MTKTYNMQNLKIKNYQTIFIVLVGLCTSLSSCLKDTSIPPLYGWTTPNVISFQDNGGPSGGGAGYGSTTNPYPSYNFSFTLQNDTAGFNAIVFYGPNGNAPEDLTLTVAVDTAALNAFNTANSTGYVCPDNTVYSFSPTVVIKKGTNTAYVHVTITASPSFDYTASYALPLSITSASSGTVSSNFGSELNIFGVKNIYDGHYTVTGTMVDYANPVLVGAYPMDVDLVTNGLNGVIMLDNAIGSYSHSIMSGTSVSYYGSFAPQFNFDPSGDGAIVSVVNSYGQPASNGRSAEIDPSGVNKRDPSTGNFDVSYWMDQPTVITPHRTSFVEHFTYIGPR